MRNVISGSATIFGAALVFIYTIISAFGDAAAKYISGDYAAPQLFALSGGLVAAVAFISCCRKGQLEKLKTAHPAAMAVRSFATVISATLFFYAMRALPLAEIFLFVGLMPIMAALVTPFVLGESADGKAWLALGSGFLGILFLFPDGLTSISASHMIAFGASLSGVISMVMARYIGRQENSSMALLFYPHALMLVVMGVALPFVFQPMSLVDFSIAVSYSALLFAGRFVLVKALAMAPAHVVMPVMNVQFVWMVILGMGVFSERPAANVYIGALIVVLSCIKLVQLSARNDMTEKHREDVVVAMRGGRVKWPRSKSSFRSHKSLSHSGYQSQTAHRSVPR